MALRIITADERLSDAKNKTTMAIFGPFSVGKTTLLKTLPVDEAVCIDIEGGMKSIQDWRGPSIPVRSFPDFRDLALLVGGPDPAQGQNSFYGAPRYEFVRYMHRNTGVEELVKSKRILFVDSITDLSQKAMIYATQQPESFSERTKNMDTRAAYGLLAREIIQALKYLQHAEGKTVIYVGALEKVASETGTVSWQPQMEGSKAGRELPGIVDQVMTMQRFSRDKDGALFVDDKGPERWLVCQSGNPWGLPAKDRSGRLDVTEPPDLGKLLAKINGQATTY